MKRFCLCILGLLVCAPAVRAEVLLLDDQTCIEDVELLRNEAGTIVFRRQGQELRMDPKRIVRVEAAVPEGVRILDETGMQAVLLPAAEPSGETSAATGPETVTPSAESSIIPAALTDTGDAVDPTTILADTAPAPEQGPKAFRIEDVRWVDDTDLLWTLNGSGSYSAQDGGAAMQNDNRYVQHNGSGSFFLATAFSGKGYTEPWEWRVTMPWEATVHSGNWYNSFAPSVIGGFEGETTHYLEGMFVGLGADGSGYLSTQGPRLQGTATVQAGVGRLYRGRHAYQAQQMIEELKNERKLLKPVTWEDLQQLSAIIAHARERYVFDARTESLEAVEAIASFLKARDYIRDVRGVLLVDDTYRYVWNDERGFGTRAFMRYQRTYDDGSPGLSSMYGGEEQADRVGVGCASAIPLDRICQFDLDLGLDVNVTYKWKRSKEYDYDPWSRGGYYDEFRFLDLAPAETTIRYPTLQPYLNLALTVYPNTRLRIGLSERLSMSNGEFTSRQEGYGVLHIIYDPWYTRYYYVRTTEEYDYRWVRYQNLLSLTCSLQSRENLFFDLTLNWQHDYEGKSGIHGTSREQGYPSSTYSFTSPDVWRIASSFYLTFGLTYRLL